ncbi:MAG: hypothetical protein Q9228_004510 [Teloschistes exilis]
MSAILAAADKLCPSYPTKAPQASVLYPSTSAALAFLSSHLPPGLDSWSSVPLAQSSTDHQLSSKLSRKSRVTFTQAFSLVILAIAVLVQLLRPSTFLLQSTTPVSHRPTFSTCPNSNPLREALPICTRSKMGLIEDAKRVATEFEYPPDEVNRGVRAFIRQMDEGLQENGKSLHQIPTYVTAVPNGTEKGVYLAVDLGGTNFRVCSITLNGDTTFSLTQSKVAIPRELMLAKTSQELFSFLAKQIESFLKTHHNDHFEEHHERRKAGEAMTEAHFFQLGFTFSFPVHQIGLNRGHLIRWTKGFDIKDTIGKDVCALLQSEIDALHLPVKVAALVNDTVGTLMARSYTSPGKTGTLLGAIFGTGTNGAYVEKLEKVTKLKKEKESGDYDASTGNMIINSEWGSFDNELSVLPNTEYDKALDKESNNVGVHLFEKRVSGMFLGEVLRRVILGMVKDGKTQLFKDESSGTNDMHSTTTIADDSPLYKQWGVDTSFLSVAHEDQSAGFRITRQALSRELGIDAASAEDAEAVKILVEAIGKRSARLSAVAIGAVIISTGNLTLTAGDAVDDKDQQVLEEEVVDIGVDGSLVEYYPGFEDYIREALREIEGIGAKGEKRIRIGIAKDGSGVGAALIALVAARKEGL